MSPIMFPFLTGMVPPLVKERLRPELVSDPNPMIEEERRPPMQPGLPMGGIGMLQAGQVGPLNRLGQFINQELAEENQGEVQEFIGEVGDMANQRFGVDLGSVGQRSMFNQLARPAVQMYEEGGAAFPDLSGDGKVTQKDILIGRGVIDKEDGGTVEMRQGGTVFEAVTGVPMNRVKELSPEQQEFVRAKYAEFLMRQRQNDPRADMFRKTMLSRMNKVKELAGPTPAETLGRIDRERALQRFREQDKSFFDKPPTQAVRDAFQEFKKGLELTEMSPAEKLMDTQRNMDRELTTQIERARELQGNVDDTASSIQDFKDRLMQANRDLGITGMQEGGVAMPPTEQPPMPMPEQPPMPAGEQLDPNVVQSALAQAAGGIGDLDQAQNYEQVMNTMRGDQATVEQRRQELAGVVGPQDAGQTPESVLTLVQPVMMLANVDQGIGELAQQEMTQPMEGPMAEGIMSTVPEPPMMEAGGNAPINFNQGGEVRPIQNFALGGDAKTSPFGNLPGRGGELTREAFDLRRGLLSDPADLKRQRDLSQAQALFDIAQTAVTFAAPMPGERPGMSPAERLALATSTTKLPEKIGASAQALMDAEKVQKQQDKAVMLSAIESGEKELSAERSRQFTASESQKQRDFDLLKLDKQLDFNRFENESNREHELRLVNERAKIQFGLKEYDRDTTERGLAIKGQLNERLARLNAQLTSAQATINFERSLEMQGIKTLDQIKIMKATSLENKDLAAFNNQLSKDLSAFNNKLSQDSMFKQQKFQAAQNALDRAQKDKIQLNDQNFKKYMQEELQKFQMSEADKNRAIQESQFDITTALKERGLDIQEGQFEITTALKERGLDLQALGLAIDEKYKSEKLAIERMALEATALGSKAETAQISYLTDAERLKKYETNTLGDETAQYEQVLLTYVQPSYTWNGTTWSKNPKPSLSPIIQKAIKTRKENGHEIPDIAGIFKDKRTVKDFDSAKFKQSLFNDDGSINFNAEGWDRIPNTTIDKTVGYEKATGLGSVPQRIANYFTETFREAFGTGPLSAEGQDLTRADRDILFLREELLRAINNMSDDRVLKVDQDAMRALTEGFAPGALKTDETALGTLRSLRGLLQRAFTSYASSDPEYFPEVEGRFSDTRVVKDRTQALRIRSLLKDVLTLENVYGDYLDSLRPTSGNQKIRQYRGTKGGGSLDMIDETKSVIQQLRKRER